MTRTTSDKRRGASAPSRRATAARREGFTAGHEQSAPADGVTFWTARRIRVRQGLDPGPAAWALAHQLGHVLMGGALPHPPGATTSGQDCTGIVKAEADAVAFITCTRYGIPVPRQPASPATWAGTDPRAQPAAVLLAAGERITTAATMTLRSTEAPPATFLPAPSACGPGRAAEPAPASPR